MTVPVICDRCRSTGLAGESDFSHLGDLLAFEPVPRKTRRADGWTAERQRAFIAALSATGSKRQAARSIGMAAFGVDQLLKADGSAGFKAAYERALAIAGQHGSLKIAQGVADAAARNAQLAPPSRLRGVPPPDEEVPFTEDQKLDLLESIFAKFMRKVEAERTARKAGKVAEADHYLRQVTFCEISFDLLSESLALDPWWALAHFRRSGHTVFELAETPLSHLLDEHRRSLWAELDDPERPKHPPERYLLRKPGGLATEPADRFTGGERERQQAEYAARYAEEAERLVKWESSSGRAEGSDCDNDR